MSILYKYRLLFILIACAFAQGVYAHSVQVGYCVSCTGELTLYVEHWHDSSDPSSTTMTIELNINGVISTQTGSPIDNIQDTPFSQLPGCTNPISIFASCPSDANTYNDWVVFKFPNLPCGVPVIITINSGNTVFTQDGCNMYPASSPTITVPCIVNPPPVAAQSQTVCSGDSVSLTLTGYTNAIQWQSAQNAIGPWTNIPGATTSPISTGVLSSTTHYRALEDQGCESNPVTITVNPTPVSDAGADITTCSTTTPGSIGANSTPGYTYSWSPPTGLSSSTAPKPNVMLTNPDTIMYVVTTTAQGCSSKDSALVIVKPIPVANAGADIATCTTNTPDSVGSGSIAGYTYAWQPTTNLSNAAISNPAVDVSVAGTTTYTVTTTFQGCVSSDSVEVEVNPMPVADFILPDVCLGETFVASGTSTVASGNIVDSLYYFGDNSPPSQSNTHIVAAAGTYMVTLLVTTDKGCSDSVSHNATVHPNPVAQFTADNQCDNTAVPFYESSTIDSPDNIQTWYWDFGDNNSLMSQTVAGGHLYSGPGSYLVELLVVSDFGCADSIAKTVVVNPNPSVNFVSVDTNGCEPLCLTFQNTSTIVSGSNVLWVLDYGDGSPSSSTDLSHCYESPSAFLSQSYTPVLTVTSDSGCVSVLSKNNYITVNPNPVAQFELDKYNTTIIDPVIAFTNQSTGADSWNWDFGDLMSSLLEHPEPHTYADTGSYIITLITGNQYNCFDTTFRTLTIDPESTFYVPNVFSPNGDGINETFSGTGIFITDYELRIFDRWGDEIYYSNNIEKPWDGTANYGSQAAQQDVYIYVITVKDIKNKKREYKGIVTLVR